MQKIVSLFCLFLFLTAQPLHVFGISKEELSDLLKENPDLIMDVLRDHPIQTLKVVQKGSEKQRFVHYYNVFQLQKKKGKEPNVALDKRVIIGNPRAKVKIVFFTDFLCHYCGKTNQLLLELLQKWGSNACVIMKSAPTQKNDLSEKAFSALYAAYKLDPKKALSYSVTLFTTRDQLGRIGENYLDTVAEKIGYDHDAFVVERLREETIARVREDVKEALELRVRGTPVIYINGLRIEGAQDEEIFQLAFDIASGKEVSPPDEK